MYRTHEAHKVYYKVYCIVIESTNFYCLNKIMVWKFMVYGQTMSKECMLNVISFSVILVWQVLVKSKYR